MTRRAVWGDRVIAESEHTQRVDGYEYFPPDTVRWELMAENGATSVCHWKGIAHYYDLVAGDERLSGAAWVYQDPSPAADHIREHIGFWRGVRVVEGD